MTLTGQRPCLLLQGAGFTSPIHCDISLVLSSTQAAITEYPTRRCKQQKRIPPSSGGWRSKVEVMAASSCAPTRMREGALVSPLQGHTSLRLGPHPLTSPTLHCLLHIYRTGGQDSNLWISGTVGVSFHVISLKFRVVSPPRGSEKPSLHSWALTEHLQFSSRGH